ncbi:hypothetical protein ALQ16_202007 [Pseudomonas syringae pv. actinidiae]|nr:hypothetical protein ALQ16_202007 [Pseudomonas syringae pv. actinidiae]
MPGRVAQGDGVAQAVGVGVDAALGEGAEKIRAVEAHQAWVIGPITITQQVPAIGCFAYFTVEPGSAAQRIIAVTFPVGAVDRCTQLVLLAFAKHALVRVRQQQQVFFFGVPHDLLAQWLFFKVQVVSALIILNAAAQLLALVETQHLAIGAVLAGEQVIVAVITVLADWHTVRLFDPLQTALAVIMQAVSVLVIELVTVGVVTECRVKLCSERRVSNSQQLAAVFINGVVLAAVVECRAFRRVVGKLGLAQR